MNIPRALIVFLTLGLALLVAGCGKKDTTGGDASSGTAASSGATDQAAGAPTAASGRLIEMTGNDTMKFNITEIRAKPGESLTVQLVNVGTMPKFSMGHNWVLVKNAAAVEGLVNDAPQAATTDYIPASHKANILAHTKLLGPKEKDSVTFQAPKEPGRYPFLCTFPGHWAVGMKGELIVE